MKYVGIVWIIVLILNSAFLLMNVKIKSNRKILLASILLILINYGSKLVFYLITGEYIGIIPVVEAYLTELLFMLPMLVSIAILVINIKKKYVISSMICSDIVALNLSFLTFRYLFLMVDLVNYILLVLDWIDAIALLFLAVLVCKWLYLFIINRRNLKSS